jgi:hypothetical protein
VGYVAVPVYTLAASVFRVLNPYYQHCENHSHTLMVMFIGVRNMHRVHIVGFVAFLCL